MAALLLAGCSTPVSSAPADNPVTPNQNEAIVPDKGQPSFPSLGKYWIIDNGCNFSEDSLKKADAIFEQLKRDKVAEVAVVCQPGVKAQGSLNDEKIWLTLWIRYIKLGNAQDRRAVAILIRPDVKPEENRVTIEISDTLPWYTAVDYFPMLEEAALYANSGMYNAALEVISEMTDQKLRELWKEKIGGQK